MTSLYAWLRFFHLLGLVAFLLAHGVSGGASLALRKASSSTSRQLLRLSQLAGVVAYPALLVLIVTGVWMGFVGHWWGKGWIWASIAVFIALAVAMGLIARPYHMARSATQEHDEVLNERLSHTRPLTAIWVGSLKRATGAQ